MMLDAQNMLSDQQSLAIAAGSVLSDQSIDLGASATDTLGNTVLSDIGRGEPPDILVQVTEAFTAGGGAATLKVELVVADDAALTTNLTIIQVTDAVAKATLVVGYQFRIGCPPVGMNRRYMGLRYTVGTNTMDTGKVSAGLVLARQSNPFVGS